jgi:hypothetical protein
LTPLQLFKKSGQLILTQFQTQLISITLAEHFQPNVSELLNIGVTHPIAFAKHALSQLTASTFLRLWTFAELTSLNLSSMHISITNDEVAGLISAWP